MYVINKTDGNIVATVNDGIIDTSQTDLTLIGRNYQPYGEVLNENFIKLLENHARGTPPTKPISGELWYDTVNKHLQVYDKDLGMFKRINNVQTGSSEPYGAQPGELWYDDTNQQLKYYHGATWHAIHPQYTASQGITGAIVSNASSNIGSYPILEMWSHDTIVGVFSDANLSLSTPVGGIGALVKGLTMASGTKINGTVTNSERLAGLLPSSYMRTDENTSTTGTLTVVNDGGITIGNSASIELKLDLYDNPTMVSTIPGADMIFRVRTIEDGNIEALTLNADGTILAVNDVTANNFYSMNDVYAEGNIQSNVDIVSGANLYVTNTAVIPNIAGNNLDVSNASITNANLGNSTLYDVSVTNLAQFNTALAISAVNIEGNLTLGPTDYVAFEDGVNEAYIYGNNGNLILGTQGNDAVFVDDTGAVQFIGDIQAPIASIDNIINGNIVMTSNLITTSSVNGDLLLSGNGIDGYVNVNQLFAEGPLEGSSLDIYGETNSTTPYNGIVTIGGGVGIAKNLNVGGDMTVGGTVIFNAARENVEIISNVAVGGNDFNVDVLAGTIKFYTAEAGTNWTPNFRGDDLTLLNDIMSVGESLTVTTMVTQGATAHYTGDVQIDGIYVTDIYWMGTTPSEGNANGIDVYTYAIIKTAPYTYTVLAGLTNFVSV